MNIKDLPHTVYAEAFEELQKKVEFFNERFDGNLVIDSCVENTDNFRHVYVYVHGDRDLINVLSIKMVNWQHQHHSVCCLYVLPVEEMRETL